MTSKQLFERMHVLEDIERHIDLHCGMVSMLDFEEKKKRNIIIWTMQLSVIEMHPYIVSILAKHVETPELRYKPEKWNAIVESAPVTRDLVAFLRKSDRCNALMNFLYYIQHPSHRDRFSALLNDVTDGQKERYSVQDIGMAYAKFLQSVEKFPDNADYRENLKAMMKAKRNPVFERPRIAAEFAKLDELMGTFKTGDDESSKLLYDDSAMSQRIWDIRDRKSVV